MISNFPSYDIFVPHTLSLWKKFDDVIACYLWFGLPLVKNSGYAYELEIAGKFFLRPFYFFWRTLASVSLVLGLGLEHSCPWPLDGLSSERLSLALASGFFLCLWPWPRALCPRLLCYVQHVVSGSTQDPRIKRKFQFM